MQSMQAKAMQAPTPAHTRMDARTGALVHKTVALVHIGLGISSSLLSY